MPKRITRRTFVKQAAAGIAGPMILPRLNLAQPANGKLQHACVGVGGMGGSDLNSILATEKVEIVALCDIDENNLNAVAERFPEARKYRDWRELLEQDEPRIDSVNVSTPDHMHAPIAMTALRKGKHVYCQKPLTHEVYEARQLTLAARKAGVVTQMGIQIHSHIAYRMGVQMIKEGAIGKVKTWHSWSSATGSTPGLARPEGEDPVPPTLDWDGWIGVAPSRPYKVDVYHPFKWRSWQDFGGGAMGDFGCHILDPPFTALGIGAPLTVRAEGPEIDAEIWPPWEIVHYEFPGTPLTAGKTIEATWYDGGKKPPRELALMPEDRDLPDSGSLFIGEEGVMVLPHWSGPEFFPQEKFKGHPRPKLGSADHYGRWVDACLGEGEATANFDYSGPLTEAVQLGNIATRFKGVTLEWDADTLTVTNLPEANARVRRPYREGWQVTGLG